MASSAANPQDPPGDPDPWADEAELTEIPQCPECGATQFEEDAQHGDVVCAMCGLVLSEGAIDYGPDWRAFNAQQREDRARAGPGKTVMRHDHGLGTVIGYGRDASGHRIRGRSKGQLARMRRFHRQATYKPGADRGLVRALTEVDRIAKALDLPDTVAETAATMYRRARETGFLHGRSIEATAAACVYASARFQHLPRPLDEVADIAQASKDDVARTYRRLSQKLKLPVPITYPTDLLPAFSSRLELPPQAETWSRKLIQSVAEEQLAGKNPASVAAAALYLAAREVGDARTQKEVANVAGVTEVTVRARLKDLEPAIETVREELAVS